MGFRGGGVGAHTHQVVHRWSHAWTLPGLIDIASGETNFITPFTVPDWAVGQTTKIYKVHHWIKTGTSVAVTLNRRTSGGTTTALLTNTSVTTTRTATSVGPTTLNDLDELAIVVSTPLGLPAIMKYSVFLETTVNSGPVQ